MESRELVHIRSLGSLRYLNLTIRSALPLSAAAAAASESGESSTSASTSCGSDVACPSRSSQSVLASLRELHVFFNFEKTESGRRRCGALVDLGPMPNLRTAFISTATSVEHPQAILGALAHSTRLTQLTLKTATLTDALLTSLLRPMTRLRSLRVTCDAIDGLSFLSAAHLADTMESLNLCIFNFQSGDPVPSMPASDLHHLRALRQLRTLELALFVDRDDDHDEPIDEYAIDHPHFPRTTWPLLHFSKVELK